MRTENHFTNTLSLRTVSFNGSSANPIARPRVERGVLERLTRDTEERDDRLLAVLLVFSSLGGYKNESKERLASAFIRKGWGEEWRRTFRNS